MLFLNYVFLEFSENISTLSSCKTEIKICFPSRVITSTRELKCLLQQERAKCLGSGNIPWEDAPVQGQDCREGSYGIV